LTGSSGENGHVASIRYDLGRLAFPAAAHLRRGDLPSVINEYSETISLLTLAAAGPANLQARPTLIAVANRLRAQAEAHRALQAPATRGLIDLAVHIAGVCACLSKSPLLENDERLTLETEEIWLGADQYWRVGPIFAELVRNAAGHGLAGRPGAIWVVISEDAGRVTCCVFDTGHRPTESRPGRGQRLIQVIAGGLKGSVDWRFACAGCRARLEFPTMQAAQALVDERISSVC
jgi:two-component sensor histidine kinase